MNRLFWVHDECLRRPVDLAAEDRWIYLWDTAYFNRQAWSFKRQLFIYETLCELAEQGCEIYQADTLAGLAEWLQNHSASQIVTQEASDPMLHQLISQAAQRFEQLQIQSAPGLVTVNFDLAPKRFFHYWKKVEKSLLGEKQKNIHQRVR